MSTSRDGEKSKMEDDERPVVTEKPKNGLVQVGKELKVNKQDFRIIRQVSLVDAVG